MVDSIGVPALLAYGIWRNVRPSLSTARTETSPLRPGFPKLGKPGHEGRSSGLATRTWPKHYPSVKSRFRPEQLISGVMQNQPRSYADWAGVCRLSVVGKDEDDGKRIQIPVDPWSNTSTGDEEWEVVYDFPSGDEVWEVTPAE